MPIDYTRPSYTSTYWTYKGNNYYSVQSLQAAQEAERLANVQKIDAQKSQLKQEYQTSYDAAKKANKERYGQVLSGYDKLIADTGTSYKNHYNTAMSSLENMGSAARNEINTQYDALDAKSAQSMISSGLHSTTVAPSVQGQNTKARQQAIALLNENLRREKLAARV